MHALKQKQFYSDFDAAQAFLADDPVSRACDVMDVWAEDDTLVIISVDNLPVDTLNRLRADCWAGNVEAYRAMDMLG
ncbi:MAG: hypothetical protein AAF764_11050 [Pseudomonadota bacterium]